MGGGVVQILKFQIGGMEGIQNLFIFYFRIWMEGHIITLIKKYRGGAEQNLLNFKVGNTGGKPPGF